ncbi:MAG: hypothetical protein ACTSV1_03795, partial [Alphaproteobacteria bacterium]
MRFLKNLRISTVSWIFVVVLMTSGVGFIASSIVAVENITDIRTIWDEFQAGRSEKARALNAVRKEIGYGGMIHQFKNFVLRQDAPRIRRVNAKLGGVAEAVTRYRALGTNAQESQALDALDNALESYGNALAQAERLVAAGKSPQQIDDLVRIDDAPAIAALNVLDGIIAERIGGNAALASKPQIVAALYKAMGYGGMIHHFKNFVLRHDHEKLRSVRGSLDAARMGVGLYLGHPLNKTESKAVRDIAGVIEAYARALVQV